MSGPGKTPFDTAASELLALEARRQRITQRELTRRTGFPTVSVGRYLRGDVPMTVGTLKTMLTALQVPTGDALDRIDALATDRSDNYR